MTSDPLVLSFPKDCPSSFCAKGRAGLRQAQPVRLWGWLTFLFLLLIALPAHAQNFPALTGRVVDQANLLTPQQEAELTRRLEALERQNSRQLVVATVADLEGYDIADYGYQLGRHWRIGQGEANNGILLLVAPTEKKVRIEVGYGLEAIVTDALAWQIVRDAILPRFRAGDMPGGILAGADALIQQLQAPPEAAEQRAMEAVAARQRAQASDGGDDSIWPMLIAMFVIFFVVLPALGIGVGRGRHYRRRGSGLGPVILWGLASGMSGGGRSWGGGGGGFGGGGFSGGGGSFGGGGASGGW